MAHAKANPIPTPVPEKDQRRFWQKVERGKPDECWHWKATKSNLGYGRFYYKGRQVAAHRMSLVIHEGGISERLVTDHLCSNPSCVNPAHLEAVTIAENNLRGRSGDANRKRWRSMTHCKNGHARTPENLYITKKGYRDCRICNRDRHRAAYHKKKSLQETGDGG